MECLDRFNAKMRRTGSSIREDKVKSSRMILDQTFYDDASFQADDPVYFWQLGLLEQEDYENQTSIAIRLYGRRYSNANGITVKFQTLLDTPVEVGDIIYCSGSQDYYLCTESFNIDNIHWQGKFTYCNWILKWQDKTGKILQYPCFDMNATQYNSGEQSTRQYTIGSSQHMIKLPCDENTVAIRTPQRFMLDKNTENPTVYAVTQNDTTTNGYGGKGIVVLTLLEDPINREKDRIDLGICDYIDINSTDNSNSGDNGGESGNTNIKSIIEYTSKVIKSGGSEQTYIARFYDENENELDIEPKWNIVCDFANKLTIAETGKEIKISIDNDDYVDEDFKLELTDEENNYKSSLIISIKSLL